jgi:hypothetical protein
MKTRRAPRPFQEKVEENLERACAGTGLRAVSSRDLYAAASARPAADSNRRDSVVVTLGHDRHVA